MKKKVFTESEINKIIKLYTEDNLGTPSIGKIIGVGKGVINRVLKDNNIPIGISGRKYKGGKSESDKRYYNKHKDTIKEYQQTWSKENRELLRDYHQKWRTKNREQLNQWKRKYESDRINNNPKYKLHRRISTALYSHLKGYGINKESTVFKTLSYDLNTLKHHIETLFTSGMSWDNYGEWHIDHVIPMSMFKFDTINDFEFKKCWELNNLQPLWRTSRFIDGEYYTGNLNKGTIKPKTCYQHRIKTISKIKEESTLGFNPSDVNINNSVVRLIDKSTAKTMIEQYEWLGYMPNYTKYHFGIFFTIDDIEYLGGVVTFQEEYGANVKTWDKYNYTDKLLLLSRGVSTWWTPKNTSSHLISKAIGYLSKNTKYRIFTATIDNLAGEVGTVYQASNWVYVGVMDGNILPNGKERTRLGVLVDNKLYTSRQIRHMLGTMKKKVILEHFPTATFIQQKAKDRYFYFSGNKYEKRNNLQEIQHMVKPYPKRVQ